MSEERNDGTFVRPGIDDRPDYEQALSPEDKEALARLAVNPSKTKAIGTDAHVVNSGAQTARMQEANPVSAAAGGVAVPDLDSAFVDMRDPTAVARPSWTWSGSAPASRSA